MAEPESFGAAPETENEETIAHGALDIELDAAHNKPLDERDAALYTQQAETRLGAVLSAHGRTQHETGQEEDFQSLRLTRAVDAAAFDNLKHGDVSDLASILIESDNDDEGLVVSISGVDADGNTKTYIFEKGTVPVTVQEDAGDEPKELPMTYREFLTAQDLMAVSEQTIRTQE